MLTRDSINLVEALVGAEMTADHSERARKALPLGPTVTIARSCGANGDAVANTVAGRLGVRCIDRELIDAIAEDAKVDRHLMERLDEQISTVLQDWSYSVIWGKDATRKDYLRHLKNVVVGISLKGGVIVGRGANYILHRTNTFRVRIAGSVSRCAERVAHECKIELEEAEKVIIATNEERAKFIRLTFGRDWNDPAFYDLTLNSDRFNVDQCVRLILESMSEAGFELPANVTAAAG